MDDRILWGFRSYYRRLPVPDIRGEIASDAAYGTASFWRYLAELDAYKEPGGPNPPPGPAATTRLSYRYLSHQLRRPAGARDCVQSIGEPDAPCDSELRWLNGGLLRYDRFQVGLRRIYPDFVAVFAAFGEYRVASLEYGFTWMGDALGGCTLVELTPDRRRFVEPLKLADVAAGCFAVQPSGFGGEVSVDVQATAIDETRLSQLTMGLAGGQRIATPVVSGVEPGTGKARTRWTFRLPDGKETRLVIANVAEAPEDTWPQTAYFTFSIAGHEHDAQMAGFDDSARPPDEAVAPGPAGAHDAVRRRVDRAADRVTTNGPRTGEISRRESSRRLIIHLKTEADIVNVLGADENERGGLTAQAIGMGLAVQQAMGRLDEIIAATDAAAAREGAEIELRIPLVDYGSSGTFDNDAEIRVSRHPEGWLEALGADRKPNGRVTIETYEPEFLSGTFSGALIEPSDPARKVVRSISGRFWISAPWEEDRRMDIDLSSVARRDIQYDAMERVPSSMAGMVREAIEGAPGLAGDEKTPSDSGAVSGAAPAPVCQCTCDLMKRFRRLTEELQRAPRRMTPEEEALVECTSGCILQLAECDRN